MEMYRITFILVAIMSVISYYLVPFLIANTSVKQRQEALFWINITVKIAEQAFKDKGIGPFKKDYVIKWLKDNNIKVSEKQLNAIIDTVVEFYNKNGWDKLLLEDRQ